MRPCHLSHPSESKETSLHLHPWRNAASMCMAGDQFSAILDWCSIRWTLAGLSDGERWKQMFAAFYMLLRLNLCHLFVVRTLPKWNLPMKICLAPKGNFIFQPPFFRGYFSLRGCTYLVLLTIVRSALKTPSTHPCKIFGLFAATFLHWAYQLVLLQNPARCYSKCPDSFWFCDEACMFVRNEHRIW